MRNSYKRQTAAWILMAVFIPMLFLASLHRHDTVGQSQEEVCYACLHHIHHDAHLNTMAHHTGDCVLCHFLSLPFLAIATLAIATPYYIILTATTARRSYIKRATCVLSLTASPHLQGERGVITFKGVRMTIKAVPTFKPSKPLKVFKAIP